MIPIPWRYVESWNCVSCGMCCKEYRVVLGFSEWVDIIRKYGVGVTQPSVSRFYLRKKVDGTCIFLTKFYDTWLCGLQNMKPKACKLWPFRILSRPNFGRPTDASYKYKDRKIFIYVDPACIGIRWGKPTQWFTYRIVPELVKIALGLREKQDYSTARIPRHPQWISARRILI